LNSDSRSNRQTWLHLGGSYWQRASFDAVVVVLSVLGLLAFAPRWQRIRSGHFAVEIVLLITLASFGTLLIRSLSHANDKIRPRSNEIEKSGPSQKQFTHGTLFSFSNEGTQLPSAVSPTDAAAHNESPVLSRHRFACESAG
jgi:hypothetical protein